MTAFSNRLKATATKAKKPIRKRRPRRELPDDLTEFYIADGERPSTLDVVGGRGGGSNKHEGNKRYWRRILVERPAYKKLGKNDNVEKNEIARAVYDYILSTGGRFLQMDPKTQKWFNLPQKIGLDKIKQALRDKYVPNFLDGESMSEMATPILPTPSSPSEGDKKQFIAFLNKAPLAISSAPQTNFISTPSIDLGSILGQATLDRLFGLSNQMSKPSMNNMMDDAWTRFPTENGHNMESFVCLSGHSLEDLMRGDFIATCNDMEQLKITAPQAPMSLQAILQQQMESAIPSSRTFAAV